MTNFASDWKNFDSNGLSADQFFYDQLYKSFAENTKNGTLPFFSREPDSVPRELSTGKIINDENLIALEQVAATRGYKSNVWIYGNELNRIQKETGPLNWKKNASPVLCQTKYFGATHLNEQNLYISEGGSKQKNQYLYNIDSLDERSRKAVLKYYERTQEVNSAYQKENLKSFRSNCLENPGHNENFAKARERVKKYSSIDGIDFSAAVDCHFKHCLQNSIGNGLKDNRETNRNSCYRQCMELVKKVESGEYKPYEAGRKIARALESGTEFQRIAVAKNYNLENAKKIEELKVAEANINRPYRRRSDVER